MIRQEYDFSAAERGRFHRAKIELAPQVRLDPNIAEWLMSHAKAKDVTLDDLMNQLLKKDIELIEAAK
jgi:hypothetical protein